MRISAVNCFFTKKVVIPTNDFGIVPALINWMGEKQFESALDEGAISFLHRKGLLAYLGNGNGIHAITVSPGPEKQFEWWQKALFGDLSEAAELQLIHRLPSLTVKQRNTLLRSVVEHSRPVEYDNEFFIKNIEEESYKDLRDTPELAAFVLQLGLSASHEPPQPLNLRWLPGVTPNSLQLAGDHNVLNAADLPVRIAETNMEIVLADLAGGTDLHVSIGAEGILRHKLLRAGASSAALDGFGRLLELNRIPDIRVALESGSITLPELWRFRQRRVAKGFRKWLVRAEPQDARDLERLYVESLGKSSLVQSLPARVLRFALTTAVGAWEPISGPVIGAIDSFFVEKYLGGYRPKLMFDEIRKIFPAAKGT